MNKNTTSTQTVSKPLVVGFFREKRDIEDFVFKAEQYKQAYHELIDQLNEKGVYVAVLMGQGSYLGDGKFSKHWVQVNNGGTYRFEKRGPITVDTVLVKDFFDVPDTPEMLQINTQALRAISRDKHKTYELLSEFHPKSVIVDSASEVSRVIADMPGSHIAIKALEGNSGKAVYVGPKGEFDTAKFNFPLPWQVQEYIETGAGVPGITEGRHDMRVVIINGQAIIATLRTPPDGGYKSNIGYGGVTSLIGIEDIPAELRGLCAKIDEILAPYGSERLYSADFGLTEHGWRLFEINAMPGTINRARGPEAVYYQDKLTDFLKTAAKVGRAQNERNAS